MSTFFIQTLCFMQCLKKLCLVFGAIDQCLLVQCKLSLDGTSASSSNNILMLLSSLLIPKGNMAWIQNTPNGSHQQHLTLVAPTKH